MGQFDGVAIWDIPPSQEQIVRLAVRRSAMTPPSSAPAPGQEIGYQSLLEITDTAGLSRSLVPVSAMGTATALRNDPQAYAGLWLGSAAIRKVNQPTSASTNANVPTATGGEFQFRLIVHVASNGQARLLRQAYLMWKDGTRKPDSNDPSKQVVDKPGRYVIVTDESKLSQFDGAAVLDGERVGRRVSSAAFGFEEPVLLNGSDFGQASNVFSCSLVTDYSDRLNPFLHLYHPDHNNQDESGKFHVIGRRILQRGAPDRAGVFPSRSGGSLVAWLGRRPRGRIVA